MIAQADNASYSSTTSHKFSTTPVAALDEASDDFSVSIPNVEVDQGKVSTVPVKMQGPTELGGADLTLSYDPLKTEIDRDNEKRVFR